MAEATGALEARAALETEADDLHPVRQRRGELRRGGAIDAHQRAIQRGRHVHQAGIVGHHRASAGHQVDGLGQRSLPGKIEGLLAQPRNQALANLLSTGMVVLRAEQPDLPAGTDLRLGDRGVVFRRPALGLAELGAGTERQHRAVQAQGELVERRLAAAVVDPQARLRIGLRQLHARLEGQGHEAFDHQRIALLVELADVIEQPVAHLAAPAGALRYSGEPGHQRRLQRVGQQDRLLVLTAQAASDPAPCGDVHHPVAEREAQGLAHLGHALEDRSAPLGRQHVDHALGMPLAQTLEQGLRHHHVPHPGGTYDQNSHSGSGNDQGGFRLPVTPFFGAYLTRVRHSAWASVLPLTRSK